MKFIISEKFRQMKKIFSLIFVLILIISTGGVFAATSYYVPANDPDPSVEDVTCADIGMGTKTLSAKLKSKGTAVLVLQEILKEYGYYTVTKPSGVFDTKTTAAVKAMQIELDIKADGVVGPGTREAMNELCVDFVSGS